MSRSKAYKHLIATNDGDDAPRNVAQCQYRCQKYLKQRRIANDEALLYKHVMFIEQSIVPLAILFHDYKKERSHNRFIQIINYEIPEIGKNCVLITDCEDALKNAFHSYYPNVEQLRCWNHLGKNIKAAAKKYFLPAEQIVDVNEEDTSVFFKKGKK
ncbi:unnamed protein product [Rotaria sp. Silwood1]|nr:unnamed protein product [Rotaria sp. Silwood1]CAF3801175.1 unnamed protein product [Rotaria sp. Silwood1]CAF3962465.1 unnamed protein product [Rotaria sp. Silwood1]CAF4972225.1 unnamed protein product [Rotaria sp. Silwood1]CAF4997001.1 unnamed protein product [Rotaria sp. Silwood1]